MLWTVASMNTKDMFILHETTINLDKLSMYVNSNPGFIQNNPLLRAFIYK